MKQSMATRIRNEVAAYTIPLLPERMQERIVGAGRTWKHSDLRSVARAGDGDVRLLVGPTNYAGQGYLWARAAETLPGVAATSLQYRNPNAWHTFPSDYHVKTNVWGFSHLWWRRQRAALRGFTHVIVEAGKPLIPERGNALGDRDIEELQALGLKVALLWHGTDVRIPSVHAGLEPYAPYAEADADWVSVLEEQSLANHALADRWGLPEFVSNPYLQAFRPGARWVPTLSDPDRWKFSDVRADGHTPVVMHVPSQGIWKGTDVIKPVLSRLHDEGVVRYLEAKDVPTDLMPSLVASADIVVDGLLNGQYGVASLEAMLSGKVAVAHTWESTRRQIAAERGIEVPVVEADPGTFERVIRGLAADLDRCSAIGVAGRRYVQEVHSPIAAAAALSEFLLS